MRFPRRPCHCERGGQVQRLKTRGQFQAVLAGRMVARTEHFAWHVCPLDVPSAAVPRAGAASDRPLFATQDIWVGALIPKRWARRAATRNAIRRQIYDVAAGLQDRLKPVAHVVRLRAGFDRQRFPSASSCRLKQAVRAELLQLLQGRQAPPREVA